MRGSNTLPGTRAAVPHGGGVRPAVREQGVGLALSVGTDTGDTDLRVLGGLPLEALEVPAVGEPFTLREMLELRRLAVLSQTPLLVEVQPEIDASRLQAPRGGGG